MGETKFCVRVVVRCIGSGFQVTGSGFCPLTVLTFSLPLSKVGSNMNQVKQDGQPRK